MSLSDLQAIRTVNPRAIDVHYRNVFNNKHLIAASVEEGIFGAVSTNPESTDKTLTTKRLNLTFSKTGFPDYSVVADLEEVDFPPKSDKPIRASFTILPSLESPQILRIYCGDLDYHEDFVISSFKRAKP